ncbi:hypothetical protein AAMO2058_001539500 [Amorphochlora amoebiformis]|mmetsp:Transcript_7078/g.10970  ORF Transcript_7078/g.10970 Transcript_7078/m.10970 type:complete len:335 (-) Transcript_7078:170-1174(-)
MASRGMTYWLIWLCILIPAVSLSSDDSEELESSLSEPLSDEEGLPARVEELTAEVKALRASLRDINKTLEVLCNATCACGPNEGQCAFTTGGPMSSTTANEEWLIPTFPQLYRVEESGWLDGLFRFGWLQQFPCYADRNFLGRFHEEGPLRKLWQDTVSFYDEKGEFIGILVESPIKWFLNIFPNFLHGRKYWRLYDKTGNLVLMGSPENWIVAYFRGDILGDIFWVPDSDIQFTSKMANTAQEGLHKWFITRSDNAKAAEIEETFIRNIAGKTKTGWLIEVEYADRMDPLIPGFFAAYNKMEDTTTTLDMLGYMLKFIATFGLLLYLGYRYAD